VRGVGRARTPNHVRRSSAPSRRPYFARASMLTCMLVLSATRTTSLILAQRTYGAANAMTLLVPRLLRGARCAHGRRGLCRLVLGLGRTEGSLVDAYGDRAPFGSEGGGGRAKSGSRQYTRAVLPSFGPHGCVKPYCCLFVCIEFLLRSDGRCQTERESVPGVE